MHAPRFFLTRNADEARRTFTKARDVWEQLVRAYPTVPALRNDLGFGYLTLGILHTDLPEERVRYHRRACELWRGLTQKHPEVPHYRATLAVGLLALGESLRYLRDWPQAEQSSRQGLEEARKLAAEFPDVPGWRELHAAWGTELHAYLLDRAGRLGEAAEVYRQAAVGQESLLQDYPKVARYRHRLFGIRILLGNVLREASRPAEAAEAYRQARALGELLDPKDPEVQDRLARFLATCPEPQFRDAPRALALAQQLVERFPERSRHWATLGEAHYATGDYPAAVRALLKAIQVLGSPAVFDDSSVGFLLAMSNGQLGYKDLAHEWYHRAVTWMAKRIFHADQRLRRAEAEKALEIKGK